VELPNDTIQPKKIDVTVLLDEFFTSHADDLFYFCYRRLGDADAAQEASSRIVLKAMKSLDSFAPDHSNPGATFRAWIYRIARNDLIDAQRRFKPTHSLDRRDADGNRFHDPPDPARGPEEALIAHEADAHVREMLGQLAETQCTIVELRLAGLRGDEIASALDMTLSAVKSVQYRAYQRLRELLADEHPDIRDAR
jgi:RNA polymerase sigma-70 factor (ECF subfamily)